MNPDICDHCGNSVPPEWDRCPHCAHPVLLPNLRAAKLEQQALTNRYEAAIALAKANDCMPRVLLLENRLAESRAVLNRSLQEVQRLASSDKQLYATFYNLLESEVRLPYGDKWDLLRGIADEALFPRYKEKIRFAALTLDDLGLLRFGECSLVLRESMIAHRASVFDENSAVFLKRCNYRPSAGHRAGWSDRAKLCVAKLAKEVQASTPEASFASLLLRQGRRPEEDRLVEVHVWGPLSIHSLEQVTITTKGDILDPAILSSLREKLDQYSVKLEIL